MARRAPAVTEPLPPAPPAPSAVPCNPEAERVVLGAALADPGAWPRIRTYLAAVSDGSKHAPEPVFHQPVHQAIADAIERLWTAKVGADLITVPEQMRRDKTIGLLRIRNGEAYLLELLGQVATTEGVEVSARLLRRSAFQRLQLQVAGQVQTRLGQRLAADDLITRLANLQRLESEVVTPRRLAVSALECADIFREPAPLVYSTSVPGLSAALGGGWQTMSYAVLNGPTKHGKSSLALQESRHQTEQGVPTMYVTCEMRRREILSRLISQRVKLPHQVINREFWTEEHQPEIAAGLRGLEALKILEFRQGMTLDDIFDEIKRFADETGRPPFVVLDYAQRLLSRTADVRTDPRLAAGLFSDRLAEATRDHGSCILALSAIPRALYGERADKLSDDELNAAPKEGGGWEYDAGVLMFLRRRGRPLQDGRNRAQLRVTGQRFAAPSSAPIRLLLDGAHNLLLPDVEQEEDDPITKEILAELHKPVRRLGLTITPLAKEVGRRYDHVTEALRELVLEGAVWASGPVGKRGVTYRHKLYAPKGEQTNIPTEES